MIRKAVYAGSFYEASPIILKKQFDKWFSEAILPNDINKVQGVICPHAGYVYSGACAAYSYKLLSLQTFKTAIIIHPSHRGNHFSLSVSPYSEYETPMGILKQDIPLADVIKSKGLQDIDASYHQNEHSMEVQLPFLAYINPEIKIVPVMIGNQTDEASRQLADILVSVVNEKPDDIVIIASTDLSHYHSAEEASRMDRKLIEYVKSNDIKELYNHLMHGKIEACGFAGVLTLMLLANMLKPEKMIELNYTHSGYTSNDYAQVVGYLSAALIS